MYPAQQIGLTGVYASGSCGRDLPCLRHPVAAETRPRRAYHDCAAHTPGCPVHDHPEQPDSCTCASRPRTCEPGCVWERDHAGGCAIGNVPEGTAQAKPEPTKEKCVTEYASLITRTIVELERLELGCLDGLSTGNAPMLVYGQLKGAANAYRFAINLLDRLSAVATRCFDCGGEPANVRTVTVGGEQFAHAHILGDGACPACKAIFSAVAPTTDTKNPPGSDEAMDLARRHARYDKTVRNDGIDEYRYSLFHLIARLDHPERFPQGTPQAGGREASDQSKDFHAWWTTEKMSWVHSLPSTNRIAERAYAAGRASVSAPTEGP